MIPPGITRDHVIAAIKTFKTQIGVDRLADSEPHLLFEGNFYPPKVIMGLAAQAAIGHSPRAADFVEREVLRAFRDLGFETGFSRNWRKRLIRYSVDLYFKPDTVDQLADVVDRASSGEEKQMEEMLAGSSPEERDLAEDWAEIRSGELSEIGSLTGELMINAIHRFVEITTKHMVVFAFPGFPPKAASHINELKEQLLERGFDIEATSGFYAFDEVRLISNAIKHNGEVGGELAKYPGWKVGQPLGDLRPHYERLLPRIKEYVSDFSQRLVAAAI